MTETNSTETISTDTVASTIRAAAVTVGMMNTKDDHKTIVDTICENMKKEFIVKQWQLLELNDSQWKELEVPIGLRVAIRRTLNQSSSSDSGVDSGKIPQDEAATLATSATTAVAATPPPPPPTTAAAADKNAEDGSGTCKVVQVTPSAKSMTKSKKRKFLSSKNSPNSSTNMRATTRRKVDDKNKDGGVVASVTYDATTTKGNVKKESLLPSSSQPAKTKAPNLRSNFRGTPSTTAATQSKGKLTEEEEFLQIVASVDCNNKNNEPATRNLRSSTKPGTPSGNHIDSPPTSIQEVSSMKKSRIPTTQGKSKLMAIDGGTSSKRSAATSVTTTIKSSERTEPKSSCHGKLSPETATTTTTTRTAESSPSIPNKVTPINDRMVRRKIRSTTSSSSTRSNIVSDVETSAKSETRAFEDKVPKKGVPKKIVLHPIGTIEEEHTNPYSLPSEQKMPLPLLPRAPLLNHHLRRPRVQRNKVVNKFVLKWNHRHSASSSSSSPPPPSPSKRRFLPLAKNKNKTRSSTTVCNLDSIAGVDTKSTTKKQKKESTCYCEYEGKPSEANVVGGIWPDGWIKRVYVRKSGASAGVHDRYWYSPLKRFKLRSMLQVNKFITKLNECNGDEVWAYRNFRTVN